VGIKMNAFLKSLPGRTVEVGYASMMYQHRGYIFVVDSVDLNEREKSFSIKPVNNGVIAMMPYREVVLLTNDRLVITGGIEDTDSEWAFRIECQDNLVRNSQAFKNARDSAIKLLKTKS